MSSWKALSVPYSEAMSDFYRDNPEKALQVLNEAIEAGDQKIFMVVLGHIIRRWGSISALAKETELNEHTLYRTLSSCGNPRLKTLLSIFNALGLTLSIKHRTTKEVDMA